MKSNELSMKQYNERNRYNAQDIDRRTEREISQVANYDGSSQRNEAGTIDGDRNSGGNATVFGQTFGEELRNDSGRGLPGSGRDNRGTAVDGSEEQHQQRTQVLTDQEVLQQAADQLAASDLTDGERNAYLIV